MTDLTVNQDQEFFDEESSKWDELPRRVAMANGIATAIANAIGLHRDMNIMEFGCGTGLVSIALHSKVGTILGIDASQGMVDVFQNKIGKMKLTTMTVRQADIHKEEDLQDCFDLVFASMVLHHIIEAEATIATLTSCLKPGGHLIIADLDEDKEGLFHNHLPDIAHNGFTQQQMQTWFENAGLDSVTTRNIYTVKKDIEGIGAREFPISLTQGQKAAIPMPK